MSKKVIFWCEFPKEVNWKKVKESINFNTSIYVTCKNKKEFEYYKKKIESKYIKIGAWPILSKKSGYWFSGFTSKKDLGKLDEFKGLNIKIDIEPPIPNFKFNTLKIFLFYLIPYFFIKKASNNSYLKNKIKELSKNTDIIVSGFAFPKFMLKRYGADIDLKNIKKSYFFYTTFFPKILRFIPRLYFKIFIKTHKGMFALGCINQGIFGNEPIYENIKEFKKDLQMFKKLNVKNIVIYSIEGIMKKGNYKRWLNSLKDYIGGF